MSAGFLLVFLFLLSGLCTRGYSRNVTSRPTVVKIGAIFTFDSTIGRVAKIAIEQAVKDVNANSSFLRGTKLLIKMQNSNCSGFVGMVQGTSPSASNLSVHFGYGVLCFALYHGHGQTPTWVLVVVFLTALKLMETDIVAILGPQSSVVAHMISHVANELQTPLLTFAATDPTLNSLQFPFFVRTTQSDLYQMAAISEIVDHYGWKQVIAIYIDDDFGRNGVSSLNDQLAAKRCRISYKVGIPPLLAANQSSIMDVLVNIALMESRVVVLHVNADIGFKVFSVAKHIGMMGNGYVWIATDWLSSVLDSNSHLPSDTMDTMQGVITLRQHTPDSNRRKAFISKWSKLTGGSLGLNSYGLYVYDSVWLVAHAVNAFFDQGGIISFSSDPKLQASQGGSLHLEAMNIFDDGPLLLKNILQSDFVGLTGQVKFDSDRSLIRPAYDVLNVIGSGSRRVGYWSNYSGLSTVPPETLYSKPPNRSSTNRQLYSVIWPGETSSKPRGWVFPNNGKQLSIGVPIRVSFREFVSHVQGTDTFNGFSIDVFTAAVNLLPYAVPYRFVPFGDGKKNPSYTELVNLVTAGVFDAAVGDIAIVTNRTKIVDFTQPYASSGLVVVASFRKLNSGAWAFLHPFSARMWIITSFSFIVVGIVVWILEHRINDEFRGPPKRQIITVLWFSLSTLFFAHKETTMSTLGRMVLIIWLFVVLIINSSYTASLTSILTVQQLSSPVKGLESLKKGDDPIGYQVGSFAEYYLSEEIGIPKSRLRSLGSPEEYAQALKDGPKNGGVVAVVDERPYIELFLASQCSFRIVGQEFTKSGWGFAFPRDSPLAVDLSTAILELSENGELQRIHDKWLIGRTCSSETSEIDSNRLQLKSFWGLFLICGLVCFIALFIYFCKIFRKIYQSDDVESVHSASGSQRHGHLKRIISLMDEKKDESKSKNKKRKIESSISADD